jgi:hypothetical protein
MSKMTELASGAITAVDTVTIELGETVEPRRSSSSDGLPRQPSFTAPFRSGADTAVRVFAAAVVKLAQLRREQRLRAGPPSRPP